MRISAKTQASTRNTAAIMVYDSSMIALECAYMLLDIAFIDAKITLTSVCDPDENMTISVSDEVGSKVVERWVTRRGKLGKRVNFTRNACYTVVSWFQEIKGGVFVDVMCSSPGARDFMLEMLRIIADGKCMHVVPEDVPEDVP